MKKVMLLLGFISVFLICSAVSAAPNVDIEVLDSNQQPVTQASPGDTINYSVEVNVDPGDSVTSYYVEISQSSILNLDVDTKDAIMYQGSDQYTNDPNNPFFSTHFLNFRWSMSSLPGGTHAKLIFPATVTDPSSVIRSSGSLSVTASLYNMNSVLSDQSEASFTYIIPDPSSDPPLRGSSRGSGGNNAEGTQSENLANAAGTESGFQSIGSVNAYSADVGMQSTGNPFIPLILGVMMFLGGNLLIFTKK